MLRKLQLADERSIRSLPSSCRKSPANVQGLDFVWVTWIGVSRFWRACLWQFRAVFSLFFGFLHYWTDLLTEGSLMVCLAVWLTAAYWAHRKSTLKHCGLQWVFEKHRDQRTLVCFQFQELGLWLNIWKLFLENYIYSTGLRINYRAQYLDNAIVLISLFTDMVAQRRKNKPLLFQI